MGGGGAMRAAAKISGIGVVAAGNIRGVPSIPAVESTVSVAGSKASRPVAAIVSSHNGGPGGDVVGPVQRPSWEIDEWEFAGGEEEVLVSAGGPMPRVVFGGAPTLSEAKEATLELKDALEKVYLKSPNSSVHEGSFAVGRDPCLPILPSNSESSEIKACLSSDTTATPLVTTNHALHAFKFLSESPAAQTVVASIASDQNVWDAVMRNEALTGYLETHKIAVPLAEAISVDGDKYQEQESPKDSEKSFDASQSENSGTGFMGVVENIKLKVADMLSNLSGYFQNIFGGSAGEKKPGYGDASDKTTFMDTTVLGSSFMGLAVLVIMVVVLKRV